MLILLVVVAIDTARSEGTLGDKDLQSALHREVVLGDLKGAMDAYRAVAAQAPRPTAARALLRLAKCLEKSGRRLEARDVYSRVAGQFGDQADVAAQARAELAVWESAGPGPVNLRFEEGTPGKLPAGWFVPALPQDAENWARLESGDACHSRARCALVLVPPNAPFGAGDLMQSFSARLYRGKTIRVRAWLRLEKVEPADQAQMWISVDRPEGRKGFLDNMSDRPIRGTDWMLAEVRARVDDDATFVKFGMMPVGHGRLWVDRVSFEVLP
jgi:hypothetical protein